MIMMPKSLKPSLRGEKIRTELIAGKGLMVVVVVVVVMMMVLFEDIRVVVPWGERGKD